MQNPFSKILFELGPNPKKVIVGIGNTLKADDGIGPLFVEELSKDLKATCINAGTTPENFIGKIIKEDPDIILIVDAVDLGKNPGQFQILEKEDILATGFTTHDISCKVLIDYLESNTQARVYMLGIQPKEVSFGEGLSPELEKILPELKDLIKEAFGA